MKYQKPINNVNSNDEFSSGLMEAYGRWMGGDTFQNTTISEAPFDGMDRQSHGAEIEDTTKKEKKAKKGGYVGQESAPKNEEVEVLEREEYEVDGETYVIEKVKGLDGKACWKGYKYAGTKMKGGKKVDNCVKAGVEYEGDELIKEYFEKENGKMVKKHNCAAKVKKEGKEYFCIPEQHTMLEDGTVTHYDLVSEQGEVLRNVPVGDLEIIVEKMHEHVVNYAKNAEVLGEKKLDPVNHKELKGDHADRKDKDIDNDGDVDNSDKYLHARRKKVSKILAMKGKK